MSKRSCWEPWVILGARFWQKTNTLIHVNEKRFAMVPWQADNIQVMASMKIMRGGWCAWGEGWGWGWWWAMDGLKAWWYCKHEAFGQLLLQRIHVVSTNMPSQAESSSNITIVFVDVKKRELVYMWTQLFLTSENGRSCEFRHDPFLIICIVK